MLTAEQNQALTRVGPGTPMGNLLRRYWHPIAAASEMGDRWTKRVRLLGEDLVLFKDRGGRLGLVHEFCPHRRASLAYGIPTEDGIRCPYHGWHFDAKGSCIDQPNEPPGSTFKNKIKTPAYPIEELGGLIFAYLGPAPIPELPRLDGYVAEGAIRMIGRAVIPCNWLQIMENSLDPVHTEWLHGKQYEFIKEKEGERVAISRRHLKIDFKEFPFGITKHRLLEGQSEESDDWRVGHPVVFPTLLAVGNSDEHSRFYAFQIRVPMDDTHTLHLWYNAYVPPKSAAVPPKLLQEIPIYDVPFRDGKGEFMMDLIDAQDIMAWVTQGPIADRTSENLGSTDQGVAVYRRMLRREMQKVEGGQDPMGVIRDPGQNTRIDLPAEKGKHHFTDGFTSLLSRTQGRYSPIARDLAAVFEPAHWQKYAGSLAAG